MKRTIRELAIYEIEDIDKENCKYFSTEETLVGLFNFTEYPAGAGLDALGGKYHTPDGSSVWLADVELEPYQALLVKNK